MTTAHRLPDSLSGDEHARIIESFGALSQPFRIAARMLVYPERRIPDQDLDVENLLDRYGLWILDSTDHGEIERRLRRLALALRGADDLRRVLVRDAVEQRLAGAGIGRSQAAASAALERRG